MIKFLKRLLRWFLPECSRCGGTMLYDNTHSWHDKWHFVCDTCGREEWGLKNMRRFSLLCVGHSERLCGLAKSMLAFVKLSHTSNLFTTLKSGRNLVFTTME